MGTSSDAHIAYGITLDEGVELPWMEEGLEEWYCKTFYNMDFEGNYKAMWKFVKDNPIPFEPHNYCSLDYPMYLLAVPGTVKRALRGFPQYFNPSDLVVDERRVEKFMEALQLTQLPITAKLQWTLFSYMG